MNLGGNLITVTRGTWEQTHGKSGLLVLLTGEKMLSECRACVLQKVLPPSVAEQAFASLLKHSCWESQVHLGKILKTSL